MKKLLLPVLLFAFTCQVFGQAGKNISITTSESGTDFRTNTPLIAREYQFTLPVFNFYPASEQHEMTVLLRKKNATNDMWKMVGRLTRIDMESGLTRWDKKQKYGVATVQQVDNVIMDQKGAKLSRLNPEDGKPLWNRQTTAYRVYPELNLALCYDYAATGPNTLHGINLKTGQSMWRREVPGEFGWQKTEMLDDTTLMVISEGLHTLGLTQGKGWSVNRVAHTKKTDMGKVGLAVLGGVAAASAGYMMIPTGGFSDYLLNISSNVLHSGDVFYFAAKEKISCHTWNGEKLWETDLNQKKTSKSHLFREGNVVYMLNMGHASKYGRLTALGNPYVAAFDAETGKELFLREWEERKNFIADYMIQNNELYMLYRDKVDIQRFSPEGLVQKYVVRIDEKANMRSFVSDEIFIRQDSIYQQASLDQDHFYLFSETGELFRFTNNFEKFEKVDSQSVYLKYLETDGYVFVGNRKETFILDRTALRVAARCNAPANSPVYDRKMYYKKNNSIYELDISTFLNKKLAGSY